MNGRYAIIITPVGSGTAGRILYADSWSVVLITVCVLIRHERIHPSRLRVVLNRVAH